MRQITALIVLLLLIAPVVIADEKTTATTAKDPGEVAKLDADDIFLLVEQVLEDPKADRALARAFLQDALDGKVTMFRLEVPTADGVTACIVRPCGATGCKKCDLMARKCWCSTCCIAVAQ